jgi:gliding motility-associated-like protein
VLTAGIAKATHNRAGEITYTWQGGLTYEVTITTYAKLSVDADRCELTLNWGDNTSSLLPRINGPSTSGCPTGNGQPIGNDVKLNIYKGTHTYPSAGIYVLFFQDPNRNGGVRNIPNSISVPFYVQSELFISPALGGNSSPILTNPPIDNGCQNRLFEHNPGAYDPDGDSLVYSMVPCRTTNGVPITSTYDPALVADSIKIDPVTGDLYWDLPRSLGQYNMAILIEEYRQTNNGPVRVGYVVRDMQVDINTCRNNPPIIDPVGPFCVEAGELLQIPVSAYDPDYDSTVTLTAFGGPFEIQNPATPLNLVSAPTFLRDSILPQVNGTLNWQTACNHVRKAPYFITLNARDRQRRSEPSDPLVDIYTFQVTVVGPSPKNPSANATNDRINLSWDPSVCTEAVGYDVYRKVDTAGFTPDTCETGVPGYTGYVQIGSTTGLNNTSYVDSTNLIHGLRYCYMVVAIYPDGAESYASVEFCANLPLVQPLLTHADVLSTDVSTGEIDVRWVAPPVIDSVVFPPPYSYRLYTRTQESAAFREIAQRPTYADTFFVHQNLNTQDSSYQYKVEFYSGATPVLAAESDSANSLYLTARPSDAAVVLTVNNRVPWLNERFVVFKEVPTGSGNFDSIGQSFTPLYVDTGLVNGDTYCYYIKSVGRYTASDSLPKPLLNRSQIACATPIDTTRPCPPMLDIAFQCERDSLALSWTYPQDSLCTQDVVSYNVYYKPTAAAEFGSTPLYSNITDLSFLQVNMGSIVGCYAVTAIDDAANDPGGVTNESRLSNVVCIEACPVLEFPNVFTPNGDRFNARFVPRAVKDIGALRIDIFNRWGTVVFSSANLDLFVENGWDGTDQNTGQPLAEGVYFYTVVYTPKSLQEAGEQSKQGFVHLKR